MESHIYSCEEHIEIAIDDFLTDTETFPVMLKISHHQCSYCSSSAVYVLKSTEDI